MSYPLHVVQEELNGLLRLENNRTNQVWIKIPHGQLAKWPRVPKTFPFSLFYFKTLVSKENIFVNEYTQLCTSNQKNLKMMKMDNKPGEKNRFPQSCCETSDIEIDKQIQCRFQSFGRCL